MTPALKVETARAVAARNLLEKDDTPPTQLALLCGSTIPDMHDGARTEA